MGHFELKMYKNIGKFSPLLSIELQIEELLKKSQGFSLYFFSVYRKEPVIY